MFDTRVWQLRSMPPSSPRANSSTTLSLMTIWLMNTAPDCVSSPIGSRRSPWPGNAPFPCLSPLTSLFPEGGLRRGSVVAVDGIGATALALAVAAGPSGAGSWTAVVGDSGLGLAAAAEAGVVLERLMVIDPREKSAVNVIAALVGAVDVVMVGPGVRLRPADVRRLSARMRERGSVLIRIGSIDAPGVDVGLRIVESQWAGLGVGHGLLQARRVRIQTQGRGASARPRAAAFLLPGPQGAPSPWVRKQWVRKQWGHDVSGPIRTLVAWCPDWPVVALGRSLDDAVAVVHANRVIAASPTARRHGVVRGLRRRGRPVEVCRARGARSRRGS